MAGTAGYGRTYRSSVDTARFRALSSTAQLVYYALSTYRDNDGVAFPSETELARLMGRSDRTIRRGIKELADFGFLDIQKVPTASGLGVYHVYRFLTPPPYPLPPPSPEDP